MGDTTRGLYEKFTVTRTDGSSEVTGEHHGCEYFVLDITHDAFALPALRAYAKSCRKKYPLLAKDIDKLLIIHTAPYFTGRAEPKRKARGK